MKTLLYLSRIEICGLALILGLVPGHVYAAENLPVSETDQFRTLKNEILEVNCFDCMGKSKENLRYAIQQLEALVNSGFDLLEPKQLLADSYRLMSFDDERNSQEQEALLEKHKQLYDELLDEYPDDVDFLVAYGALVSGLEASERARLRLRELLAEASYYSGVELNASTNADERERGLELLLEAYELAAWGAKKLIGVKLVGELEGRNLTERADEIKAELREEFNLFRY